MNREFSDYFSRPLYERPHNWFVKKFEYELSELKPDDNFHKIIAIKNLHQKFLDKTWNNAILAYVWNKKEEIQKYEIFITNSVARHIFILSNYGVSNSDEIFQAKNLSSAILLTSPNSHRTLFINFTEELSSKEMRKLALSLADYNINEIVAVQYDMNSQKYR
ncbi:MAG: hypothetical protein M1409_06290 [Actinobacteria bacterium]|nr:hypothetical protein [Actinomycetota bacterium]